MSLADIATKAGIRLQDKAGDPRWVDSVVNAGRGQINSLPRELQGKGSRFLDEMLKEREGISSAGRYTFGMIVNLIKVGKIDEAKCFYLRERATAEERRHARDVVDAGMATEIKAREETWATVKRVAERALELGQHALPFILALI